MDFETAFTGVTKTIEMTAAETEEMRKARGRCRYLLAQVSLNYCLIMGLNLSISVARSTVLCYTILSISTIRVKRRVSYV